MAQPVVNLPQIGLEAQTLETELAPEQQVRVSEAHVIASGNCHRTKAATNHLYASIGVLIALLLTLGGFFYFKVFYIPSARVEAKMCGCPPAFSLSDGQAEVTKEFISISMR